MDSEEKVKFLKIKGRMKEKEKGINHHHTTQFINEGHPPHSI
jgi:hypothetical protein